MSSPAWTIQKKRDGEELSSAEIHAFIKGLATGDVADYQATAFLMAVFFRGMSLGETVALTEAMLASGERYDLSSISGPKIDKHSTGGVGDKVSLILAPLAAACGLKVPMMSGRGLGHSGGTLDKLESIQNFDVRLSRERFEEELKLIGCSMIGQSATIAPADKKLYALRDVTATVECIPLIVASILSKKIAEGSDALVFDVKVGSGAFMKTRESALKLGRTLSQVSKKMGLKARVLLTDMNQPLGYAVGNSLEMIESIQVLRDQTPDELASGDLKELTIQLCAQMLELGGLARNTVDGRKLAHSKLTNGSAWKVFEEMVRFQGGSIEQIRNTALLPKTSKTVQWKAKKRGFIAKINTEAVGRLLVELGGGRKQAADTIDPAVGLVFHRKLGAKVANGEPIVTAHIPENADKTRLFELEAMFQGAVEISRARKPVPKLIIELF